MREVNEFNNDGMEYGEGDSVEMEVAKVPHQARVATNRAATDIFVGDYLSIS